MHTIAYAIELALIVDWNHHKRDLNTNTSFNTSSIFTYSSLNIVKARNMPPTGRSANMEILFMPATSLNTLKRSGDSVNFQMITIFGRKVSYSNVVTCKSIA